MGETGNCGYNPADISRTFTLEELSTLKIGELGRDTGGCTANNVFLSGKTSDFVNLVYPQNAEFYVDHTGPSCSACSLKNGCRCNSGNAGHSGRIYRKEYRADPYKCCLGMGTGSNKNLLDGVTCDPKYLRFDTTDCDENMNKACGTIKTNERCTSWMKQAAARGNQQINETMRKHCSIGDNYSSVECQNWVSAVHNSKDPNVGKLADKLLIDYCKLYNEDQRCKCVNLDSSKLPEKLKNLIAAPKNCWATECNTSNDNNFKTYDMFTAVCPQDLVVCSNEIGQVIGNPTLNLSNKCDVNINNVENTSTSNNTETNTYTEIKNYFSSFDKTTLIIGIVSCVVVVIILIVIMYFIFFRKK